MSNQCSSITDNNCTDISIEDITSTDNFTLVVKDLPNIKILENLGITYKRVGTEEYLLTSPHMWGIFTYKGKQYAMPCFELSKITT